MSADFYNGLFETLAACFLLLNVRRLYIDKVVKGYSVISIVFFTSWSVFNLFFYPAINCWWSFAGGCFVVTVNTTWVMMLLYYTFKGRR